MESLSSPVSKIPKAGLPAENNPQKFHSQLKIIPWGGKSIRFELTNTCPMDNFLFMIHTLAITHDSQIMSMAHPFNTLLRDMNNFIKQGRFAEAKNHCFMQLPNPPPKINGVIDVYGMNLTVFLFYYQMLWKQTLKVYAQRQHVQGNQLHSPQNQLKFHLSTMSTIHKEIRDNSFLTV